MSTVLTLTLCRRRSPRRNRGIPTIAGGYFNGRRANVSAVDTWLCGEWVRQVLGAHSGSLTSGVTLPVPAWSLQVLAQGTQKSWFDDDLSRVFFRAAYCTRVGVYWSGVVRTARIPGPCGVHPTLCQWIPTLVQFGWCQV